MPRVARVCWMGSVARRSSEEELLGGGRGGGSPELGRRLPGRSECFARHPTRGCAPPAWRQCRTPQFPPGQHSAQETAAAWLGAAAFIRLPSPQLFQIAFLSGQDRVALSSLAPSGAGTDSSWGLWGLHDCGELAGPRLHPATAFLHHFMGHVNT